MQKATKFSKTEIILVAVNSIITKLFLIFPATLTEVGKSASVLLSIFIIVLGYLVLYIISILYEKFSYKSILKLTENTFGKTVKTVFSLLISIVFILINGLFLRCVSESISLSLMPDVNVNIISLIFITGVLIAVYSGLKAIVRSHAVIVPITLTAVILLFIGSINSFDFNNIYPLFGDGLKSFAIGSLLCSYFADYFVITLLFPYMQENIKVKSIINYSVLISSVALLLIIVPVLLTVETNTIIPVFKLGQNFRIFKITPRLESLYTALWFASFFLNFSILFYFSCKLLFNNKKYKNTIIPLGFVTFGVSIIPKNIYEVSKYLDILSIVKIIAFFILPIVILSFAKLKTRRKI